MTTPRYKLRGRPFENGNPGRPRGARNKTTLALESLLDGQAEAIIAKTTELALKGNPVAIRLCFGRLLGARSERPISLELPPITTAAGGAAALAAVVAAVARGEITPREAADLSQLISTTVEALEAQDLERRIETLEKAIGNDENLMAATDRATGGATPVKDGTAPAN